MSDLEPINFSHFTDSTSISINQKKMSIIKERINKQIGIKVEIKKFLSSTIVLSVDSASAASELRLRRNELLPILSEYKISNIQIIIH